MNTKPENNKTTWSPFQIRLDIAKWLHISRQIYRFLAELSMSFQNKDVEIVECNEETK